MRTARRCSVERLADGAHLVIKEIRSGHMTEEELAKAQQEAAVLGRLRHGNIIACVESFVDPALATFNIHQVRGLGRPVGAR